MFTSHRARGHASLDLLILHSISLSPAATTLPWACATGHEPPLATPVVPLPRVAGGSGRVRYAAAPADAADIDATNAAAPLRFRRPARLSLSATDELAPQITASALVHVARVAALRLSDTPRDLVLGAKLTVSDETLSNRAPSVARRHHRSETDVHVHVHMHMPHVACPCTC